MKDEWIAHPNRFKIDTAEGSVPVYRRAADDTSLAQPCAARIGLPDWLAHLGDLDVGAPTNIVRFSGPDWWFLVGLVRTFTIAYILGADAAPPRPFGFRRGGTYWWWNNTTTTTSLLDGSAAADHVREYVAMLIPGAHIELFRAGIPA